MSLRGKRGLMLALDVTSLRDAVALVERVNKYVDAIKIGSCLLTAPDGGLRAIAEIAASGLPVLVDSKLLDAPHITMCTINNLVQHGASSLTIYALSGEEILRQCIRDFEDIEIFILTGQTYMCHEEAAHAVLDALEMAARCGYTSAQVPGNYPDLVKSAREELGTNACLVACGIGAQGGVAGDAIRAGADFEIVGRDIYKSPDPIKAIASYKEKISLAMQEI